MDTFQTFLNACRNGQKNIVKILLERGGIDLNRRDAEGNTALHYACREGYRDLAVLLLEKGADASSVNNRSETPLHTAARSGNREIIAHLVEAGARRAFRRITTSWGSGIAWRFSPFRQSRRPCVICSCWRVC